MTKYVDWEAYLKMIKEEGEVSEDDVPTIDIIKCEDCDCATPYGGYDGVTKFSCWFTVDRKPDDFCSIGTPMEHDNHLYEEWKKWKESKND